MATRQPYIDALLVQSQQSSIFAHDVIAGDYGQRLFSRLLTGLESHNFSILHLALRHFEWLVPQRDASPEILENFDQVFVAAPTVAHADLSQILTIEESSITSPLGLEGFQYFYIRELVFTGQELSDLINYMRISDDSFKECSEWTRMLETDGVHGSNGCDTWTLRFVGTVEGPHRPIDRLNEDLDSQLLNVLGETYFAVENVHPHIIRDARVYLLPDATISPESGTTTEDTERLLIELFHHPSLLNRQRFLARYTPTPDEDDEFMALETDAWQTFKLGNCLAPDSMYAALTHHFEEVQEYANSHPAETGTSTHPFTDAKRSSASMNYSSRLPST
jgi:hypothetical protein